MGWLDKGLRGPGAHTVQVTAERRDVTCLSPRPWPISHCWCSGEAVTHSLREGESLGELRKFGTPPYVSMGNVMGRLLTQNHRPYAAIQQAQGADEISDAFASAARALADSFSESSLDEIESAINGRAAR